MKVWVYEDVLMVCEELSGEFVEEVAQQFCRSWVKTLPLLHWSMM